MRGEVDTYCSEVMSLMSLSLSVSEEILVRMGMSALPTDVGGVLTVLLEAAGVDSVEDMIDEVDGLLEGIIGGSWRIGVGSALANFLSSGWLTGGPLIGVVPKKFLWKLQLLALVLILPDLDDGLDNGCESNICTRLSCAGACR